MDATVPESTEPSVQGLKAVALVGNPNTGKTTLFNGLTGLFQRVGNYPGVTVERKMGRMRLSNSTSVDLVDLPGTYSLAAHSPDEMIVADVLLGQQEGEKPIGAVVAIVDASNLQRHLYLVSQVIELGLPTVIALNMTDIAEARGIQVDAERLSAQIGLPVVPVCASRKQGLDELRDALARALDAGVATQTRSMPQFPEALSAAVQDVAQKVKAHNGRPERAAELEVFRALIDEGGYAEQRLITELGGSFAAYLKEARSCLPQDGSLRTVESEARYAWVRKVVLGCVSRPDQLQTTSSDRIDRVLTHKVFGTLIFVAIMGLVFQAIYTWSGPLMDWIDGLFGWLGTWAGAAMPEGALRSLVVDGVIAGAGGVVIFLPQIAILFLFISILEDCGYMARAAFLMDRLLTRCGLSGKSFIPMLSSFACAVPGIMATRTIEDRRDRFTTILVAPLMSCSARLPVYTIFIGAFVPDTRLLGGWVGLQGFTLLGMYALGIFVAIPVAWLLKKTLFRSEPAPFILEFPSYKLPDFRTVGLRVYLSSRAFIERAGTIILAATVVMWALAYFPRPSETIARYDAQEQEIRETVGGQVLEVQLAEMEAHKTSELMETSFLARAGHWIEPAVRPLGWDWRIGMATIASFPAREVIVATLGTIFSLSDEADESSGDLREALRSATWPDGRPLFNVPVALSVMVFFALCAQCVSTLAVIRREMGSWWWALFTFSYMTGLAYLGALVVYQAGMALGWGG